MKPFFILIVVILFSFVPANGQVLYKCISPKEDTVTYLFGTCHYLPKKQFFYDKQIDSIIRLSELVFSEYYVKEGDLDFNQNLREIKEYFKYENNQKLKDFIERDDYQYIINFYRKRFKIPRARLEISSKYIPLIMHQQLSIDEKKFAKMDIMIYQSARKMGKEIYLLDDLGTMKGAAKALKEVYNPDWLIVYLKDYDNLNLKTEQLYQSWLKQDSGSIAESIRNDPVRENEVYDLLVKNRNIKWVKDIEEQSRKVNFLYAGFAHLLLDDYGLITYFINRGYKVEPVSLQVAK